MKLIRKVLEVLLHLYKPHGRVYRRRGLSDQSLKAVRDAYFAAVIRLLEVFSQSHSKL